VAGRSDVPAPIPFSLDGLAAVACGKTLRVLSQGKRREASACAGGNNQCKQTGSPETFRCAARPSRQGSVLCRDRPEGSTRRFNTAYTRKRRDRPRQADGGFPVWPRPAILAGRKSPRKAAAPLRFSQDGANVASSKSRPARCRFRKRGRGIALALRRDHAAPSRACWSWKRGDCRYPYGGRRGGRGHYFFAATPRP